MKASNWDFPNISYLSIFLVAIFICPAVLGQGSRIASSTAEVEEADRDNPGGRETWFRKGRTAPPGKSAAELRLQAHQQKMQLRTQRMLLSKASAVTTNGVAVATWVPLGPAPLASDASGGFQDYGKVSGRATAIAVDPADSTGNTVFIGGADGGLWKSTNAAAANPSNIVWNPVLDNQPTLSVGAIAIQPGNSNPSSSVILVGTGEANSSGDSYYGLGILRSANGGNSWSLIPSADAGAHTFKGLAFGKIAFSGSNANLVVAATSAAPVGIEDGALGSSVRGIYASGNAGQTWALATVTDAGIALSPAPSASSVIFNSFTNLFYAAVRFHGIYASSDGLNWSRLTHQPAALGGGLNASCPSVNASNSCPIFRGELAVVPGRALSGSGEMYVWYVDANDNDQGVWRTTDGGNNWTQIPDTSISNCGDPAGCGTEQGFYNLALAAVPNGGVTDLYAGAINLFKCTLNSPTTTACSQGSWLNLTHVYGCNPLSALAHVHPDQHAIAYPFPLPNGKALIYLANDGGIYRALDGFTGLTTGSCAGSNLFDDLNAALGSMTQFVSFSQDMSNPVVLLGGTQDNGSPASNQVGTNLSWQNVNAGDGGYNEINPANTNEWFTANTGVSIQRCTSGISCNANLFQSNLVVSSGTLGGDIGPFYTPYILDPQSNTSELLVGTCRVWRGPGIGGSFVAVSDNFDTGTSTACMGTEINQVHAIAVGGQRDGNGFSNVIYATTEGTGPLNGVSGGRVFATTNAATTPMADVTSDLGNSNAYTVSDVAVDVSDPTGQTAYVAIMGFGGPHVSKTINAGASWTDFTANLPDAPANTLVIDAAAHGVYVGTDVGVFSSPTSSPNWTEVGPAPSSGLTGYLPNVPVTKLRIFSSPGQKLLRASTYGRGIWQASLVLTPDYNIGIANSPGTIFPSQQATFNGSLTAANGYASSVALSCTAGSTSPPSTCTPSPASLIPTGSFTVTAAGSVGDYNFNVHGVGSDTNAITHDRSVTLHVIDFGIGPPSPTSMSINRPGSSSTTFNVTASGPSFNQAVTLSCPSGLPTGAACSFSPSSSVNPTSTSPVAVTLTITAGTNTPTGSSTVSIAATTANAPSPKTQSLTLTVTAVPDYVLAVSNSSASALVGQSATFAGTLTATNGYNTLVTLSCGTGAPPTCAFSPSASIRPTAAGAAFTVTVGSNLVHNYSFNILSSGSGALHASQSDSVTFDSLPDFAVADSTGPQSIKAGQSADYRLTFTPVGAATFSSAITYTCSVTPAVAGGPGCQFNPPSPIAAGTPATNVTLTVSTAGPNALRSSSRLPAFAISILILGIALGGGVSKSKRVMFALLLFVPLATFLLSCGGNSGGGNGGLLPPPQNSAVTVTINPASARLFTTSPPMQFNATVSNASNTQVAWQVNSISGGNSTVGSIDATGLYTPPATVPNPAQVRVTAVAQADASKSASAMLTIAAPTPSQTYTLTVTASSGSVTHTTTALLTVQ